MQQGVTELRHGGETQKEQKKEALLGLDEFFCQVDVAVAQLCIRCNKWAALTYPVVLVIIESTYAYDTRVSMKSGCR